MLTHDYTYEAVLRGSVSKAWTVDDCFRGRDFDFTKPFLPERIAGVRPHRLSQRRREAAAQPDPRKQLLPHLRVSSRSTSFRLSWTALELTSTATRPRLWALLRFAEEEVKHQEMLGRAMDQFQAGFGVACGLVPGREAVAAAVLDTSPLTALLLTSMIEWFTQLHYVEHVQDGADLDGLFRDILRFHWIDESRHARMDSLLIDEVAGELTVDQREEAIDQLLELGGAVDGLLAQQVELDIDALQTATGRTFSEVERDEIRTHQRRAYRWTFLVSGLQHPNFVRIVEQLTDTGADKIATAAQALAA